MFLLLSTDRCASYRVEWGKAPMWGKGPTTEITFMDGNRGNICTRVFSYVIGPPGRAVADGENTSEMDLKWEELFCPHLM